MARRTRPRRTSSTEAMVGLWSGKMRSTPTPAETFRTVKFSLMPPPRLAMTQRPRTPGAAPCRLRGPAPSPGRCRPARMQECPCASPHGPPLPIAPSSNPPRPCGACVNHVLRRFYRRAGPQIGPPLARQPLRLRLPPRRDLARDCPSAAPRAPRGRDTPAAGYSSAGSAARRSASRRWPTRGRPARPGSSRTTASSTQSAAGSPPESTKSPTESSSVASPSATRWSTSL